MATRRTFIVCLLAVGLSGCARSPSTPPSSPGQQVNGTERLSWDQSVGSGEAISTYRFAALVDGVRVALPGAGCMAAAEALYSCSSGLPPMSAGPHSLQLIAINGSLESPPSTPPLSLVLVAGQSSAPPASSRDTAANDTRETTADGVNVRLETLASGLDDATDLAPAPGGMMFVAERAGRIRLYRDALVQPAPVAALDDTIAAGGELLALAVDPGFSANRWVYAVHTTARSDPTAGLLEFHITRFTALDDSFADRVTLLAGVPAASARSAAALRFGPDGKLYAAFDDGGSERAPNDLASYNGKVLRLNPDGTTPADQPLATPVLAGGFQAPRTLAWSEDGGVLWVFQSRSDGSERMTPVRIERPLRAELQAPYALPQPFGIGGAALYSASLVPEFKGNQFVGAGQARYLLRLRFDPSDPLTVASTEHLLQDRVGEIRGVTVGSDGAVYVATANALLRLAPIQAASAPRAGGLQIIR